MYIWIYWSEASYIIYFYIVLNKIQRIYWFEQSTGLGLEEDWCLLDISVAISTVNHMSGAAYSSGEFAYTLSFQPSWYCPFFISLCSVLWTISLFVILSFLFLPLNCQLTLLWFTDSDCHFGIFKLFLKHLLGPSWSWSYGS